MCVCVYLLFLAWVCLPRRYDGNSFQLDRKIVEDILIKLHIINICAKEKFLAAMLVTLGQGDAATEAVKNFHSQWLDE